MIQQRSRFTNLYRIFIYEYYEKSPRCSEFLFEIDSLYLVMLYDVYDVGNVAFAIEIVDWNI